LPEIRLTTNNLGSRRIALADGTRLRLVGRRPLPAGFDLLGVNRAPRACSRSWSKRPCVIPGKAAAPPRPHSASRRVSVGAGAGHASPQSSAPERASQPWNSCTAAGRCVEAVEGALARMLSQGYDASSSSMDPCDGFAAGGVDDAIAPSPDIARTSVPKCGIDRREVAGVAAMVGPQAGVPRGPACARHACCTAPSAPSAAQRARSVGVAFRHARSRFLLQCPSPPVTQLHPLIVISTPR